MKWVLCLLVVSLALAQPAPADAQDVREAKALLKAAGEAKRGGDRDKALSLYTKAIDTKALKGIALAGAYNQRAVTLSDMGRKKDAIADMSRAIAAAPKQPFYYGNRARIYLSLKEPAKAAADFSKVIELKKQPSAYDYFYRCSAYAQAKMRTEAISDCETSLKLRPTHRRAAKLLVRLKAAQ